MILRRAIGLLAAAMLCLGSPAVAQTAMAGQVAVGVVTAKIEPVYETSQYVGRILAENTVNLVARVTGFLEQRLFRQGSDVAKGQLLYVIEQPPYQAAVAQSQAAVAQAEAQLSNAITTLSRQLQLLHTPAGQQSTVDNDRATQLSDAAQLASARAPARDREYQPRLYRDPGPDRGSHRHHQPHRGQCRRAIVGNARDDREPGSDVPGVRDAGGRCAEIE